MPKPSMIMLVSLCFLHNWLGTGASAYLPTYLATRLTCVRSGLHWISNCSQLVWWHLLVIYYIHVYLFIYFLSSLRL